MARQQIYLKNWGFHVEEHHLFLGAQTDFKNIFNYYDEMLKKRDEMAFEIDGVVVKINDLGMQEKLGSVGNKPRYAIAWKFPPEVKITKLLEVKFQVGRTGKITPVGILEPVMISGALVQKVTLHNENEIILKDIRINDFVKITRSGDVIPKVLEVVKERRDEATTPIEFPKNCPVCHSPLVKSNSDKSKISKVSPAPKRDLLTKMFQFVSKKGMNVAPMSREVLKKLITAGKVTSRSDLYKLKSEDFAFLPKANEALIHEYLKAIENSKHVSLSKFLYSLAIKGLSEEVARALADKYKEITKLYFAPKEEFFEIHGVGKVLSEEIHAFFHCQENLAMIDELIAWGIRFTKSPSLGEFICSLGISGLKEEAANILANRYEKITKLYFVTWQDLHAVQGLEEELKQKIHAFFNDKKNIAMIDGLMEGGLDITFHKKKEVLGKETICPNKHCPVKKFENILHFASKKGMDIEGFSEETIRELMNNNKINNVVDIYKLKSEDFDCFARMGEKLKQKYLTAIENSKTVSLGKFIYALGIKGIGEEMANVLADNYLEIKQLYFTTKERLASINEIGEILNQEIHTFFNDEKNLAMIDELIHLGVKITFPRKNQKGKLFNKRVVFTGTLASPRNIMKGKAKEAGAKIASALSKKVDYLIVGKNAGSKVKKAQALGIEILAEESFLELLHE